MPIIRYNNTANKNASDIARRAQGRAVFANALVNEKSLNQNCLNRVAAGPAAATSFDATKYYDQRVGAVFTTPLQAAEIIASSPCVPAESPPIIYPNYELGCNDSVGIQIMASGSFTKFTFTTSSQGTGVLEFQFFLNDVYQSSQLVVLNTDSNLITPPPGIDEVRYVFRCTPLNISLECVAPSKVLQWTVPYSFTYTSDLSGDSTTLTLYKHPISDGITETHTVYAGQTFVPSPAWGYDAWAMAPCTVGSIEFPGTSSNKVYTDGDTSLSLGAEDFTVEWYQYYDDDTASGLPRIFSYDEVVQVFISNIQNNLYYYEVGGSPFNVNIPAAFRNTWCHFAVCRSVGIVYLYQGGVLIGQVASTSDLTTTNPLTIGNNLYASTETGFKGKLTNFRLTPGYALYPGGNTFTPPTTPLLALTISQLLLDVSSPYTYLTDSSPANRTVVGTDVSFSYSSP